MNQNYNQFVLLLLLILTVSAQSVGQTKEDTLATKKSKVDKFNDFNAKAEAIFKIIPVPIYGYSTEAGSIYGLAKNNVFSLSKKDTISKPSKISGLVSNSTEGRLNVVASSQFFIKENKYQIISYLFYQKQPQYIFGIGNDVGIDDGELINFDRIKFYSNNLMLVKKDLYIGIPIEFANYWNMQIPSESFLYEQNVLGIDGGYDVGVGLSGMYDTRKNPYNPQQGVYCLSSLVFHPKFLGSTYQFTNFILDVRKYYNPWLEHIIALQFYTSNAFGDTPFYDLSMMGGSDRMRGFYQGGYRDKALVDSQLEYRAPIWNIFGLAGFIGTGRVFSGYNDLSFEKWRFSYGGGLRIMVDSKHKTNLRFDFGFGNGGSLKGTYVSFSEAF
ncbi:BamA/TamA family outer membrane protein [Flavobacterium aquicola]|uniref:Surface antigen-like protein n=1 Tax=Flavobacterium aquicola TaxID=1682742 RepID=A0A3E0EU18_9FLAO|nr:BamA/TamA family outer membrane protein [Flavobacterium aquicola]REH01715.1 surface antigen-like protein [Flavobacterium aquicola]